MSSSPSSLFSLSCFVHVVFQFHCVSRFASDKDQQSSAFAFPSIVTGKCCGFVGGKTSCFDEQQHAIHDRVPLDIGYDATHFFTTLTRCALDLSSCVTVSRSVASHNFPFVPTTCLYFISFAVFHLNFLMVLFYLIFSFCNATTLIVNVAHCLLRLKNLGNTCFINVVLQSLFVISGFCDEAVKLVAATRGLSLSGFPKAFLEFVDVIKARRRRIQSEVDSSL